MGRGEIALRILYRPGRGVQFVAGHCNALSYDIIIIIIIKLYHNALYNISCNLAKRLGTEGGGLATRSYSERVEYSPQPQILFL
jgi:hypothetical protein